MPHLPPCLSLMFTQASIRWPMPWHKTVDLFNQNGIAVWFNEGKIVQVTMNLLHEIITRHIAFKELVNRGTETNPDWVVECVPYVPDSRTVRDLFSNERREGGLLPRLTKVTAPQ